MAAVILLLAAAGLVVMATIAYTHLPPKKMKPWLCSVLRRAAAFLPKGEAVRVAASKEEEKKKRKGVVAVAGGRAELERVFATFDKNGDGYITVAELEESLRNLGLSATREEVACMVEKLDANGDGLLDLGEFWELYNSVGGSGAAAGREEEEEEEPEGGGGGHGSGSTVRIISFERAGRDERDLKEAFDVFDSNGDGLITVEELSMVLSALGLAPGATSAARCRDMIRQVDMDGDGMVSFEEFKGMMTREGRQRISESLF